MGLSKKRKQLICLISARAAESHKHGTIDRESERKKRGLKKQREEEDYWDEFEEHQSESSSDESNIEFSSLDESSSDKDNLKWTTNGGIIHMKGWERMEGDN